MSVEEINVKIEEEIVEELMVEGFSDLVPDHRCRSNREVTVANPRQGEPFAKVPEDIPFLPLHLQTSL